MLAVFGSGMTSLAIELTASRVVGRVFGTSNMVWASIIGLILIYLSAGYWLGGRWADRSPRPETFNRILVWAAFLSGLIPLVNRPVIAWAAQAVGSGDAVAMVASFMTALATFSVPVVLLGCVSPFAVRLRLKERAAAGRVAGRVYAVSTGGSILGTFLPVLVFIPLVGTTRTFLIFSLSLMTIGLLGLTHWEGAFKSARYLWMPAALIAFTEWVLGMGAV